MSRVTSGHVITTTFPVSPSLRLWPNGVAPGAVVTELKDSRSLLSIFMFNIYYIYHGLGVSLSSSRSWRHKGRCESHRKEGLQSTLTNQKKKVHVEIANQYNGKTPGFQLYFSGVQINQDIWWRLLGHEPLSEISHLSWTCFTYTIMSFHHNNEKAQ